MLGDLLGKMGGDDMASFAKAFQQQADQGGFNPMAMLTGAPQLRAVCLAPMSPDLLRAREAYLNDGTGPLADLAEAWQQQGHADAADNVRAMVQHAQGMLVLIAEDQQGPLAAPQYFHGNLEDRYIDELVQGLSHFDSASLRRGLEALRRFQGQQVAWPETLVLVDGLHAKPAAAWRDILTGLAEAADESLIGGMRGGDLSWWAAEAVRQIESDPDGEVLTELTSAYLQAGAVGPALACAGQLLQDYEVEDEELAELLEQLVQAAQADTDGLAAPALTVWFGEQRDALDDVLGGCYELAMPVLQATLAANADYAAWLQAAQDVQRADRKALRQALTREPIWRIAAPVATDDLLTPDAAADLLDRSVPYVTKRMEAGLLPTTQQDGQFRIVGSALKKWADLLQHYQLLD
jgi:hypothetical protein